MLGPFHASTTKDDVINNRLAAVLGISPRLIQSKAEEAHLDDGSSGGDDDDDGDDDEGDDGEGPSDEEARGIINAFKIRVATDPLSVISEATLLLERDPKNPDTIFISGKMLDVLPNGPLEMWDCDIVILPRPPFQTEEGEDEEDDEEVTDEEVAKLLEAAKLDVATDDNSFLAEARLIIRSDEDEEDSAYVSGRMTNILQDEDAGIESWACDMIIVPCRRFKSPSMPGLDVETMRRHGGLKKKFWKREILQ